MPLALPRGDGRRDREVPSPKVRFFPAPAPTLTHLFPQPLQGRRRGTTGLRHLRPPEGGGGKGSPPPLTRSLPSRRRNCFAHSGRLRNAAPSGRERLTDWSRLTAHALHWQSLARSLFPPPFPPTAPPRGRGRQTERGRTGRGVLRMLATGRFPPSLSPLALSQRVAGARPAASRNGAERKTARRRAFRLWLAHAFFEAPSFLFFSPTLGPRQVPFPQSRLLQTVRICAASLRLGVPEKFSWKTGEIQVG